MKHTTYSRSDFSQSPLVVFYEVTRACDLVCQHCRACAQPLRDPGELGTGQAQRLLTQLAEFPKPPLLVFTGGDPLKRPDINALVEHGVRAGMEVAMTPSATPLVTRRALERLACAGLSRLAISLDGADAATHDELRGVPGSYDRTLEIMFDARFVGVSLQVNTTVTGTNFEQIDRMAEFLASQAIVLWSVFFLIPVGRGGQLPRIEPQQHETVFARLWRHAQRQPYAIKTTEAPHYRRFVLQQQGGARRTGALLNRGHGFRAPLGINDGKGVMFVDHIGRVFPSGFLPIECGRFPRDSIVDVYQNAEIFRKLRDPKQLRGKCGDCDFRNVCGGSRARAYAVTNDPFAPEPDCMFVPSQLRRAVRMQ